MWKWLPVFMILLFLIGCVQKPSASEMAQADYGRVPDSYASLITYKLQENLPDPHAVTIEVSRPYRAMRALEVSQGGGYEYGHVVHAWVIPKDNPDGPARKSPKIFWWSNTGWSTILPSLDGVTPRYREQAEEYSGKTLIRY